ncbi:MAG: hypothetical protein HY841_02750 [Bacteroidetes bacterium]|nr:hypothetical protein [Bacteroidota bacterium]
MKFKDFLKKINFKKDSSSESNLQKKFIKDLENNEVIYIDGKPFLKVKIKFVGTENYETSKKIDLLEEITTEQEKQIKKLNEIIISKDSIILSLENLTRNTKHELENKLHHHKELNAKQKETTVELHKKVTELNTLLKNKNNEIIKLNMDLVDTRSTISSLVKKKIRNKFR